MRTITHYDDPFLTEIDTNVISCTEDKGEYLVELDETLLYVESGGQPQDYGWIDGNEVVDVYIYDNRIFHVLKEPVEGSVHVEIDFERRLQNMQNQSVQHMVGSIFYRKLGLFAPSAHVYSDGTCSLTVDSEYLTPEDIEFVEDMANELIIADTPYYIEYVDDETCKEIAEDAFASFDTYRGKATADGYRVIIIEGLDHELCGCIHVPSASIIRGMRILDVTRVSDGIKVHLVAGEALLKMLGDDHLLLQEASQKLNSNTESLLDAIDSLKNQIKQEMKDKELYRELYLESVLKQKQQELDSDSSNFIVIDDDIALEDMKYLIVNLVKNNNVICVGLNEDQGKASIVLSTSQNLTEFNCSDCFAALRSEYKMRGGGNPHVAQGGGEAFEGWRNAVLNTITENFGI